MFSIILAVESALDKLLSSPGFWLGIVVVILALSAGNKK